MPKKITLKQLEADVRACQLCESHLPHGVRPVLQVSTSARILIVGQAPGRKVHETGVPFDDASGKRLREWLGVDDATFYNPRKMAILPMGFCYPGTGKSGDLPPRPECAQAWREGLLQRMPRIELTVLLGQYALGWHIEDKKLAKRSVTQLVQEWQALWPAQIPLPHPSPRNNIWLKRNPWFEADVLPVLKARVAELLGQ